MTTTRRLAAILAADVAGYSAAMERDEEGTAAAVRALRREVIEPKLAEYQGRLIKTTGDGFLAEFASPIAALNCALAIQQRPDDGGLRLRIGLNLGDVIIEEGGDLLGEGVNIAARLEGLAEPGGILVSDKIVREVEGKVQAAFEDRGEQHVKNISKPVRTYAVRTGGQASAALRELGKPLSLPDKPSIAVLPFQNMSGDVEQEYFVDGLVEDIITALSRFKSLFVTARNSSFTYKSKAVDIKQVGSELGVRYVLEGSVRKGGGRLRITGQLIEAETNHHIWADRFDGALEDIFDLQDAMTEQVVGAIAPAVQKAEMRRMAARRPENLDAYALLLKAAACRYLNTLDGNREGLALAYRAIEIAPDYGAAYAMAAWLYVQRNIYGMSFDREKDVPEAVRLAHRALALASDDPEVLCRAGLAIANLTGDLTAIAYVDRALELNPNNAHAWQLRGAGSIFLGEPARAIEQLQRALRFSPLDPSRHGSLANMANANLQLERFDEAREWAEKAYNLAPLPNAARVLIASSTLAGRKSRSDEVVSKLLADHPDMNIRLLMQGIEGWREADKRRMAEALKQAGLPE